MKLNVLYCSNDGYAPFCAVSIFSLLESNRFADEIAIYLISDGIGEETIHGIQRLIADFGKTRRLVIIDGGKWVKKLNDAGHSTYRGTHAANLRLFFPEYIEDDVERLLYLDCDTLVVDNLSPLFTMDMGDAPAAAVRDSLTPHYKTWIGFSPESFYFNSGVVLFHTGNWKAKNCTNRLCRIMADPACHTANTDQDYLNYLLKEEAMILSPRYNFQTTHMAFSDRTYFSCLPQTAYYTKEELNAARERPSILHAYRFLGGFAWSKSRLHPMAKIYHSYACRTLFGAYRPRLIQSRLYTAERILYRILPRSVFFKLFVYMQDRAFLQKLEQMSKEREPLPQGVHS